MKNGPGSSSISSSIRQRQRQISELPTPKILVTLLTVMITMSPGSEGTCVCKCYFTLRYVTVEILENKT